MYWNAQTKEGMCKDVNSPFFRIKRILEEDGQTWKKQLQKIEILPAALVPWVYSASKRNEYRKNELRGLSPRANYTDLATAACRRS
jgi:hypothetical protein